MKSSTYHKLMLYSIFLSFLFCGGCGNSDVDLEHIDKLIQYGQYDEAQRLLL